MVSAWHSAAPERQARRDFITNKIPPPDKIATIAMPGNWYPGHAVMMPSELPCPNLCALVPPTFHPQRFCVPLSIVGVIEMIIAVLPEPDPVPYLALEFAARSATCHPQWHR
jgi:hypothetical protein